MGRRPSSYRDPPAVPTRSCGDVRHTAPHHGTPEQRRGAVTVADRYQALTSNPVGTFLAKNLGLPNPPRLRRYTEGDPLVSGDFLVGGDGRPGARRRPPPSTLQAGPLIRCEPKSTRYQGLVFDATSHRDRRRSGRSARLLHPGPALAGCAALTWSSSARHPRTPAPPEMRIAQRALEGLHPLARQGDRPWRHRAARLRRGAVLTGSRRPCSSSCRRSRPTSPARSSASVRRSTWSGRPTSRCGRSRAGSRW